jgi:cysteine desulfurase/selenocysteine lyase
MSTELKTFDIAAIREDFPILSVTGPGGKPLAYLDNGASTQRPTSVLEAMEYVERTCYANVHRSGHGMSSETTSLYEASRDACCRFINAASSREIVFTPGTTGSINLVARTWGDANVRAGDEILLTEMEHHSNIVPWQQLAARTGATIRWAPITDDCELDLEALDKLLTERTKILAVTALSNVLGTITPIGDLIAKAHAVGAIVLVDGAQSVPHLTTDVQALDADFLAFSGHKLLGPNGVGVLYGKEALLEAMPPFLGGGSMIRTVTREGFTCADLPAKFEAGTPPIVPAIGLKPAIEYLERVGLPAIHAHEQRLCQHAQKLLGEVGGVRMIGPPPEKKGGITSFVLDGIHPKDVAVALDFKGIAIREGHHCAMPLHARLGLEASCRASFYLYNTLAEVERLADSLRQVKRMFA